MTYYNAFSVIVSIQMASEMRQWVEDEIALWPDKTAYQKDLHLLSRQLDKILKSAKKNGVII